MIYGSGRWGRVSMVYSLGVGQGPALVGFRVMKKKKFGELSFYSKLLPFCSSFYSNLFQFQVLFGLSAAVNVDSLAGDLLSLLSKQGAGAAFSTVASSEYKLRTTVSNFFQQNAGGRFAV